MWQLGETAGVCTRDSSEVWYQDWAQMEAYLGVDVRAH